MSHPLKLRRTKSRYGRIIEKPNQAQLEERIDSDKPLPIQDQIEGLRIKIALKDRYNKVILEEFRESRIGAKANLQQLFDEIQDLRIRYLDAIESEKTAVQHSLRMYAAFQRALTDKSAQHAIPWLKDKLFDMTKKYSLQLYGLAEKRNRLEDAEQTIKYIEKWPLPGSLGWERDLIKDFYRLENKIEITKAKVSTVGLLHSTYVSIKSILQDESGKYQPILKLFQHQCVVQVAEFKGLQKMLKEAILFREDAEKNLKLNEQEASQNRKFRRKQMFRIRKVVEEVLADLENNDNKNEGKGNKSISFMKMVRSEYRGDAQGNPNNERMKNVIAKITELHELLRRVLSIMRVNDISQIAVRTHTVQLLSKMLTEEYESKLYIKESLQFQKSQLYLIYCNMNYTGQKQGQMLSNRKTTMEKVIQTTKERIQMKQLKLEEIGNIFATIRFSGMSILSTIEQTKHKKRPAEFTNIKEELKVLYAKLSRLYRRVHILRRLVGPEDEDKDYSHFYHPPPVPPHHIRVGSPNASASEGADSDEDDFIDSKIPGRLDIKKEGRRLRRQAIIAKGLR